MATLPTTPRVPMDLRRVSPFMWACIAALVLMFWVAIAIKNANRVASPAEQARAMQTKCEGMAHEMYQFVNPRLRSPGSASYNRRPMAAWVKEDGNCIVTSWVDSQNGFGALLRTHFQAHIAPNGDDTWRLLNLRIW